MPKSGAFLEHRTHAKPVAAEPLRNVLQRQKLDFQADGPQYVWCAFSYHKFSGPLLPPRDSAMPAFSLSANLTLVTAEPRNKYNTVKLQPLHPSLCQSIVPRKRAWPKHCRVSILSSLFFRTTNPNALSKKACTRGTGPLYKKVIAPKLAQLLQWRDSSSLVS